MRFSGKMNFESPSRLLIYQRRTNPAINKSKLRMQLSPFFGIGFRFCLISDFSISGWSGFPHFRFSVFPGFMISGFEVVAPKSQFYDPKWDLLGWFSILEQTITSGQLLYWAIYRKSSIKPSPGAYFFQALLRGSLIERGGGLKRERGAYLI